MNNFGEKCSFGMNYFACISHCQTFTMRLDSVMTEAGADVLHDGRTRLHVSEAQSI